MQIPLEVFVVFVDFLFPPDLLLHWLVADLADLDKHLAQQQTHNE